MRKKAHFTQILYCKGQKLKSEEIEGCREAIEKGGVIVFPTDTVYGIACNAFNPSAVQQVYELKGRAHAKPLPIFLAAPEQLGLVVEDVLPETAPLIKAYWPGPLTLVFKTGPRAMVASHGRTTIAVRVPDHGVVRDILTTVRIPLAVTSANVSGKPALTSGKTAVKVFDGLVDVIVDGGECEWSRESSVVDVTHYPFTVLREGAISKTNLAKQLNLA